MDFKEQFKTGDVVKINISKDSSNFYVLGNSWGGILAMEYALKYQQNIGSFQKYRLFLNS